MAYDDPGLLHYDQVLTGISVGYGNDDFVGQVLMPTVNVNARSAKYNVYDASVGLSPMNDIRAPKAKANEVPPITFSRDTYYAEEHALADFVAQEEIDENDGSVQPLADSTERLADTILLNKEVAIFTMATATATYATGNSTTLSGTAQWNDWTNSNPIGDFKAGRDAIHLKTRKFPNVGIIGYDVATQLEDHTKLVARFQYVEAGMTTFDMVARLIGSPGLTFYKAGAVQNTANLGQTPTYAYSWGKNVVLAYVNPNPGRKSLSFGYEYNFPFGGNSMPTERWYDNDHDAWKVRVRRRYDLKLFAVDTVASGKSVAGYLIKNAVA